MTVLKALRQSARRWWYHEHLRQVGEIEEARKREHDSVRSTVKGLRQCLDGRGYLTIGRGGWTLHHSRHGWTSGYGADTSGTVRAARRLGVPVIDSRTVPDDLIGLTLPAPIPAHPDMDEPDAPPWGSFAKAPLPVIEALYHRMGATLDNVDPSTLPALDPQDFVSKHLQEFLSQ
jgi:hypothetical protein